MNRVVLIMGGLLATLAFFVVQPLLADEAIRASEFAARCAAAGGNLTLDRNLRVEGGVAEMGACTIALRSSRLFIRHAELSFTEDFTVRGEGRSEIHINQGSLYQSDRVDGAVNIRLQANMVQIQDSQLSFSGDVRLLADGDRLDRGMAWVEASELYSLGGEILITASRNASEGKISIEGSKLFAETDISLLAGDRENGLKGHIEVTDNAIVAWHRINFITGKCSYIGVQENNSRTLELDQVFTGIYAMATLTIACGDESETEVFDNRILAQEAASISTGEHTSVQRNNFQGSGPIMVRGPRCETRQNTPEITCTR